MCDHCPNIIFKNLLLPLKISHNHKFSQGNNTLEERCFVDPTYKYIQIPCYHQFLFPFFLLLTLSIIKRNTTPPPFYALYHPTPSLTNLSSLFSIEHQRRTTNGSKNKFRIYMIYFYSWGLLLHMSTTEEPLFCINNEVQLLKVNDLRTHHFLNW